jgi:hypothetical protein
MRRLLFRLAVSGFMLLIGIAASSLRHALGHRQVIRSENTAGQLNAQNVTRALEGKNAATDGIDPYAIMVTGRYSNFDYAYSVLVPEGMMGAMSPDGFPNHGFGIDLTNPTTTAWTNQKGFPRAYVWVDGSYNSAELASLDAAVQQALEFLNEEYGHSRLLSKTPTRLGGLRAVRFVTSYDKSGEATIEDEIIAFRTEHDADIVYTIALTTPASRYARDKSLVTKMQKSWLADPLPDVYPLPPAYEESK